MNILLSIYWFQYSSQRPRLNHFPNYSVVELHVNFVLRFGGDFRCWNVRKSLDALQWKIKKQRRNPLSKSIQKAFDSVGICFFCEVTVRKGVQRWEFISRLMWRTQWDACTERWKEPNGEVFCLSCRVWPPVFTSTSSGHAMRRRRRRRKRMVSLSS